MALIPVSIQGYYDDASGDVVVDQDSLAVAGMEAESGASMVVSRPQHQIVRHQPSQMVRHHPHRGHQPQFTGRGSYPGTGSRNSKQVTVRSGFLGLGSTTVALSSDGQLDAVAQEPLLLSNLTCDGDTGDFVIEDIKVGSKSIFSGVEAVPAGRFRPDATGKALKFRKPMFVGQTVTVFIHNNNSGASRTLSANFDTIERAN